MAIESLAAALEREHHSIDDGIEAFTAGPLERTRDTQPLIEAMHALRRHIYLEEQFLFPQLRAAGLVAPIFVMLREHGQLWQTLDALQRELDQQGSGAAALTLCHELTVQLQHHNMKEERILYPQADQVLDEPAGTQLREFLDSGELPSGWVCERAQN